MLLSIPFSGFPLSAFVVKIIPAAGFEQISD